jgi:uncharacterized protein (DUF342 family)
MKETVEQNPETLDSQFELTPDEDRMQVTLDCSPEFVADEKAADKVLAEIKRMKIVAKPDLMTLGNSIKDARNSGEGITNRPIVFGQPPEPPVDAKVEWTADYFTKDYYVDPETKLVDFHRRVGNPSVEEKQLLVKITRERTGKNGKDVFGRAIVVPKPKPVPIKPGPNVYWDEEASGFRARCTGRVSLRGQLLDVDPICFVKNGVGTESGNIKHNGKVVIDGDVEMDFKVEAKGDIEIRGLAYASDITSGGSLAVRGGINGDLDKKIVVKGDILAKYIINATVISEGNIISNNEIIHSQIKTGGEVNCNKGRIIGGEIHATRGISVGEAGAEGNIKTLLIAGVDLKLQQKQRSINEEIGRLKEAVEKLESVYRKLEMNLQILNHDQKEKMVEIQYKLVEGREEIERLEAERKNVGHKILDHGDAVIKIFNIVRSGVVLRICDCQYVVAHALEGPLLARLDRLKGEIELTSEIGESDGSKNEG